MHLQLTHPLYALLPLPALTWVIWFGLKSDVQLSAWRRWVAVMVRALVVLAVILAIAGLQWLFPIEGMNVFFVLDRSDSIPPPQQELAKGFINKASKQKKNVDK